MSVVAPPVPAHAEPVDRRRGIPGLRGTGVIGHVCAAVLLLAVLIAILGPFLAPHDPEQVQLKYSFVGPFEDHYLGFDGQGRDLLSRLLWGARTSLLGPLFVVALAMGVGTRARHRVRLARRRVRLRRVGRARRAVRVPRHPARRPRRRGLRLGPDGGVDRAGLRLHPVRLPRAPQRVVARARPALHRGPRGAGPELDAHLRPAPRAERPRR